uniref:Uncharacterized protein n=1 Tax=Strigamia maritima TaxID=126957 RepID=T1II93_STRMM
MNTSRVTAVLEMQSRFNLRSRERRGTSWAICASWDMINRRARIVVSMKASEAQSITDLPAEAEAEAPVIYFGLKRDQTMIPERVLRGSILAHPVAPRPSIVYIAVRCGAELCRAVWFYFECEAQAPSFIYSLHSARMQSQMKPVNGMEIIITEAQSPHETENYWEKDDYQKTWDNAQNEFSEHV